MALCVELGGYGNGGGGNHFIHVVVLILSESAAEDNFGAGDCSLYLDMPLCLQIANVYMNRAIGHYLQEKGLYVIPNVRWGDERTFTTDVLPEKVAFLGIPKHSIVSIGTYGCIKSRVNKQYFIEGLSAMLDELSPEVVLVYGGMPESIFGQFKGRTDFVNYPDWISTKRRRSA